MQAINAKKMEQLEQIAFDIKKEFDYDKGTGKWAWYDRGERCVLHGGFDTRFDALWDAVEPYLVSDADYPIFDI